MPTSSTSLPAAPPEPTSSGRGVVVACLAAAVGVLLALTVPTSAFAAPPTPSSSAVIEALAPYQGQTTCDPVARAGVVAFRDLVLAAYPGTGDSGIVRSCTVGGTSEHKEGRAWDWRVSTSNATQVAQVNDLLTWLTATDQYGNPAAMARRLGVMYIIWDSKVWKSYQASKGWQAYTGASPHTDHVHLSFAWNGAYKETSYWTGKVAPVMYGPTPSPAPSATPTPTASPAPSSSPSPSTSPPSPSTSPTPSPTATTVTVDRAAQLQRRRAAVDSLPGPWRRH